MTFLLSSHFLAYSLFISLLFCPPLFSTRRLYSLSFLLLSSSRQNRRTLFIFCFVQLSSPLPSSVYFSSLPCSSPLLSSHRIIFSFRRSSPIRSSLLASPLFIFLLFSSLLFIFLSCTFLSSPLCVFICSTLFSFPQFASPLFISLLF